MKPAPLRCAIEAYLSASTRPAGEAYAGILAGTGIDSRSLSKRLNKLRYERVVFVVGRRQNMRYFLGAEKHAAGIEAATAELAAVKAARAEHKRLQDIVRSRKRTARKKAAKPAKREPHSAPMERQPALRANVVIKKRREELPVTYAPDCKHTVCPCGKDQRYTFTPEPGWRGAITQDWLERRLQETKQ